MISTFFSSLFSYQIQSRYIFESSKTRLFVSPLYLGIQLGNLGISAIVVPLISKATEIGYIPVQFLWSAFISLISLAVIYLTEVKNKSKGVS
jgi:hypothetical protein